MNYARPASGMWVKVACAAALTCVLYLILSHGGDTRRQKGVGEKLGETSLATLTGDPPPLDAQALAGHVALLDFWGPWCPPCRAELPHLAEIQQRLADHKDFLFIPVACGTGADDDAALKKLRRETEECLSELGLTLATYADPNATTRAKLQHDFGMTGYPFTLLLDRDGVVRGIWEGYAPGSEADIEKQARSLLGD